MGNEFLVSALRAHTSVLVKVVTRQQDNVPMLLEDLLTRLATLTYEHGHDPASRTSSDTERRQYDDEGDNVVEELQYHLDKVYVSAMEAGTSNDTLRRLAKQNAKGLLRIAQTGLKNTKGGTEPLRLACGALKVLLALSPFVGAADLVMEKLSYQAIARSVDLGEFSLGLHAAAYLQTSLHQFKGDAAYVDADTREDSCLSLGGMDGKSDCSVLRLRSFAPPNVSRGDSLELAKLISGASLNTCRCALEVGSMEALGLIVGSLGHSAGKWINRVSHHGEVAKADAYRDHLFKLLWRACSALEQLPNAPTHQTVTGRQRALEILTHQQDVWNTSAFVAYAHRGALALERLGDGNGECGLANAAELSTFCHRALCRRSCVDWPVGDDSVDDFQLAWIEWLQYSAGLYDKLGDFEEAQRLLVLAYKYVCASADRLAAGVSHSAEHHSIMFAAYCGMLKIQAATTTLSQHPYRRSSEFDEIDTSNSPSSRQSGTTQEGMAPIVYGDVCRGLEHMDILCDLMETKGYAACDQVAAKGLKVGAGVSISAAVKAWKWTQKACRLITLWVEPGEQVVTKSGVDLADLSALITRSLRILGDLSRTLLGFVKHANQNLLAGIPHCEILVEVAFDSYLRVAQKFTSSRTQGANAGPMVDHPSRVMDETEARKSLCVIENMCRTRSGSVPPQQMKRVGVGWFSFGQTLVGYGQIDAGLDALVRGCQLLEHWSDSPTGIAGTRIDVLRSAQLDLRLSKLSEVLMERRQFSAAAVAITKALSFSPDIWCLSGCDQAEFLYDAQALVTRYVSCRLRCGGSTSHRSIDHSGLRGNNNLALGERVRSYLSMRDELHCAGGERDNFHQMTHHLLTQGLSADSVAWILFAKCRAYRAHLPVNEPEGVSRCISGDSDVVSACIRGHRAATHALIGMSKAGAQKPQGSKGSLQHFRQWEAQAHVLSAWFEHDLFLMEVASNKGSDADASDAYAACDMADLPGGVQHALLGSDTANMITPDLPPSSAAVAGVCACVCALLKRDLAEPGGGMKEAMHRGLDLLAHAIKKSKRERSNVPLITAIGPPDAKTIVTCLKILEAHYALHRDTSRMVKALELRIMFAKTHTADDGAVGAMTDTFFEAGALSNIGVAYHEAGVPSIASTFRAIAHSKFSKSLEAAEDGLRKGSAGDFPCLGDIYGSTSHEVARASADTLRGLCLADQKGGAVEAESVLRGARQAVSEDGDAITAAAAAYLQCVVGMGLSWLYERRGRLVEAMEELRQVLRVCHVWASSASPPGSDRQVLSLLAARGSSVHDEESVEQMTSVDVNRREEGVGEENADVDEAIQTKGALGLERKGCRVVLSSTWLPLYVEGLTRMGRLWRARGFATKASGYLRQGCVVAEPLYAARLLRDCLVEEIEVAAQMHRFDRANRLLRACWDLVEQERGDQALSTGCSLVPGCPICDQSIKPRDRQMQATSAKSSESVRTRGRGTKRVVGRTRTNGSHSKTSLVEGPCVSCRQFNVNTATLLVIESDLLRRQGDFGAALAACKRGQVALAPLVEAVGRHVPLGCCSMLEHDTLARGSAVKESERNDLGWRASEVLALLRLQQGRAAYLLGDRASAKDLLEKCVKSERARVLVRAAALYRLGQMSLDDGDMVSSREPLRRAEALIRETGEPKLVRKVRRALAVALTHPGVAKGKQVTMGVNGTWRVAALSSLSIGTTHCNQVGHVSAKKVQTGEDKRARLLDVSAGLKLFEVVSGRMEAHSATQDERPRGEVMDAEYAGRCLSEALGSELRAEWPIISLCMAAGRENTKYLLITRMARTRPPVTVSVPLCAGDSNFLNRWKEIMEENRETLRGHSVEEAAAWGNKEKAGWWQRRAAVDEAVDTLLRELEEQLLAPHGLTSLLMGKVVEEELEASLEDVCDDAHGRIRAARRTSSNGARVRPNQGKRGKINSKGQSGAKARGPAVANADDAQPTASGMAELVAACVHGGNDMSESGWLAVVRLALSGVLNAESTSQEIARYLHHRVQSIFAFTDVAERCRMSTSAPDGDSSEQTKIISSDVKEQPPTLDIEAGRSACYRRGRERERIAKATKPAKPVAKINQSELLKLRVVDLRKELSARGIATRGLKLKSDLVAKLVQVLEQEALEGAEAEPDDRQAKVDTSKATLPAPPNQRAAVANPSDDCSKNRSMGPLGSAIANNEVESTNSNPCWEGKDRAVERHPVILVLDEELQTIPWEALPCLRSHAVTRVPAVPFIFSALATYWDVRPGTKHSSCRTAETTQEQETGSDATQAWIPSRDGIRLDRGFYILDPELNLPHTRNKLSPILERLKRQHDWGGMTGEAPTEDQMKKILQDSDVFTYCGHGAGELLISRDAVAGLSRCPVAVLMGCSSGRLRGYGEFEPTGMVSSYLAAGSPAIVANLWDVTDKDIDRFSVALLDMFARSDEDDANGGRDLTLAHVIAQARTECKMAFIIGHAPVCYGIPITVARRVEVT